LGRIGPLPGVTVVGPGCIAGKLANCGIAKIRPAFAGIESLSAGCVRMLNTINHNSIDWLSAFL
jgi:hypothetical protein